MIRCGERWKLVLLACCICACDDDERPPFHNGFRDADGGSDGGKANAQVIETDDDEVIEETVSQWATLEDPDVLCAGWGHTCGIKPDGTVMCWGANGNGQSAPPNDKKFKAIACGDYHVCGIRTDDTLQCWGAGSHDELEGYNQQQSKPPEGKFKEITAGGAHSCGITEDDEVVCWGAGAPDDENGISPNLAQAIAPGGKFRSVSAGEVHTCAIEIFTDEIWCWGGLGEAGPSGDCFPPRSYACGQTEAPPGGFATVSAGFAHTCALTFEGTMACWGAGKTDVDCDPNGTDAVHYECGQAVELEGEFVRLELGHMHSCVIDAEWKLQCVGWNINGASTPPDHEFSQVAAGDDHTCAVRKNGSVECFGGMGRGETSPPTSFPGKL